MAEDLSIKRSPLHQSHLDLQARMIPFAGWDMPVQYRGIVDEHLAVREKVGVFDISHMGEFIVEGPEATSFLNYAFTNDIRTLDLNQGQYTLMLNAQGGVIDDLIVYRIAEERYYLVVNASMIEADLKHLQSLIGDFQVKIENLSDQTGALAIQGPLAAELLEKILPGTALPARNSIVKIEAEGDELILCGTGYTGENGFEFFTSAQRIEFWFKRILAIAESLGGMATGLGARDTLRLEMGYPLNGNDLFPDKTPLEAGLGFFVKLDKGAFVGSEALIAQKVSGVPTRLTAFQIVGNSPPPRPHYKILHEGIEVGEINSGGLSPSLKKGIGMAYLPAHLTKSGIPLEIEIRGRKFAAVTLTKPFYQPHHP